MMTAKLKTSAFSVYLKPLITSGAIHWYVPIFEVMTFALMRVQPKSASFAVKAWSRRMLRLLRSRWRIGYLDVCK